MPAPPVGAELPPVPAGLPPVAGVDVTVFFGAAPPVGAELPPALAELEFVDEDDEPVPVVFDVSVGGGELLDDESLGELEAVELVEGELVESPVVPVAAAVEEVVPVAAFDELSAAARLAEAVGSTRLGIVRGTGSVTCAPPQALRASPPRRTPSIAVGRAGLFNVNLRLGPCDARRSSSR